MDNPTWVPRVAIMAAHFEQLREHGGIQGIRDPNGLDAAIARPMQRYTYEPESDESDLAAAYAFGLARGHCFADGNKRVALATMLIFLELNGYELAPQITDDELSDAVVALAKGDWAEPVLAAWLRERIVAVQP